MMTPVLEEISEECSDKVKFCKVNIESVRAVDMPEGFSVSAIPTLMTVKNGEIVAKEVGLKSKEAIQSMIEEVYK
jgi:thioredoxin 1